MLARTELAAEHGRVRGRVRPATLAAFAANMGSDVQLDVYPLPCDILGVGCERSLHCDSSRGVVAVL